MLMWLTYAFLGVILYAASTIFDKYIVSHYFKTVGTSALLIFTAGIGLVVMPLIIAHAPQVLIAPPLSILLGICSGVSFMVALYFYLEAELTEDASTAAPMFQLAPVFTLILGYFLLHESLTATEVAGCLLITLGSSLLSLQFNKVVTVKKHYIQLMIACSLSLAASMLLFKWFVVEDAYWTTMFWTLAGEGAVGVLLMTIPNVRHDFFEILRINGNAIIGINLLNEIVFLSGQLSMRYALLFAPVAAVQSIDGTMPLFTFLFAVLLSVFVSRDLIEEDLSRTALIQKSGGIAAVVLGTLFIG